GPRTPVEEMLVEIWQEVLQVERVGIHDDFFELGGDSLLVTRILSQIREKLKVEVALRMMFELPTVRELGEQIEELQRGGEGLELPPLRAYGKGGSRPLSYAQERLWFLEQMGL